MKTIFSDYLSISIMGAVLIGIVLLTRLALKKSPRWIVCILWALVCVRLLVPFRIESEFSLQPSPPMVSQNEWGVDVSTGIGTIRIPQSPVPLEDVPALLPTRYGGDTIGRVMIDYLEIASWIWIGIGGVILMYTFLSYLRMKWKVREAVRVEEGVYSVFGLDSAFLLGYIRPKIYLPAHLSAGHRPYVIAHEKAHKMRGDNWLKLLGFLCLALHWFNPFVWIAYGVFCRDIEVACDEKVVRDMDMSERKTYSMALLNCSVKAKSIFRCPVAFGEVSVKQRITAVLNFRKPVFWLSTVAIVTVLVVGLLFLTEQDMIYQGYPQYFGTLYENLGKSRETVCKALNKLDFTWYEKDAYAVAPVNVVYNDMQFSKLYLLFTYDEEILQGFYYRAHLPNDNVEKAIADLSAFVPKLNEDMALHGTLTKADPSKPEIILNKYKKGRQITDFNASWIMSIFPEQMQQKREELNQSGRDAYMSCSFVPTFFNEKDAPEVIYINATLRFDIAVVPLSTQMDDRDAISPYDLQAVISRAIEYAKGKGLVFSVEKFTKGMGRVESIAAEELKENGGEEKLYQMFCEMIDHHDRHVRYDGYDPSAYDFGIDIEYHKSDVYEYYELSTYRDIKNSGL